MDCLRACTWSLSIVVLVVNGQLGMTDELATQPAPAAREAAPKSPVAAKETLGLFGLPDDLRMELVAAEPQVVDPIEVRFDARGRMWVVEMRDYPFLAKGLKPRGRIRVLTDKNDDGYFESAITFADGLADPTGLQPWQDGVIVTLAGKIQFLRDTNGDGQADDRQTWFEGFATANEQLRANHPRLGPDGLVYVANGLRGGKIIDLRDGRSPPMDLGSRDFRFHPRGKLAEPISGKGQFGLTFDAFGNRFFCSNRDPLNQVIFEDGELAGSLGSRLFHQVVPTQGVRRLYPLARAWTTSTLHSDQFTAACGILIAKGSSLPNKYRNSAWTCEPTASLVHREKLVPHGPTFVATPGDHENLHEEVGTGKPAGNLPGNRDPNGVHTANQVKPTREFLASRDSWFRPVNLTWGPDGALYVVDMYRAVIEHPQWMPQELKTRQDLRLGNDRGRIYRITAKDAPAWKRPPNLAAAKDRKISAALEHRFAWYRESAFRLLQQQGPNPNGVRFVRAIAQEAKLAESRVLALRCLANWNELRDGDLLAGMRDKDPRVQAVAVKLADNRIKGNRQLAKAVSDLAAEKNGNVRFRVALAVRNLPVETRLPVLTKLAAEIEDWQRRAIVSSAGDAAWPLLKQFAAQRQVQEPQGAVQVATVESQAKFIRELSRLSSKQNSYGAVLDLAIRLANERDRGDWATSILLGMGDAARERKKPLHAALASELEVNPKAADFINQQIQRAASVASNCGGELATRLLAVELLEVWTAKPSVGVLLSLAKGEAPSNVKLAACDNINANSIPAEVRLAAIGALTQHPSPEIGAELVRMLPSATPSAGRAILDTLLASPSRSKQLLDAIAAGRVKANLIDPVRQRRLYEHRVKSLREQAQGLFQAATKDRNKVISAYRPALELVGNNKRGQVLFAKHCAACHRIGQTGKNVGPDITDTRTKSPQQLLTDILNPNAAINGDFFSYSAITQEGRVLTGIIVAETADTLTLRQPDGRSLSLQRSDLDVLRNNGISLMPEGLEQNLNQQQMADLISYLKNWRYLDGTVPLK